MSVNHLITSNIEAFLNTFMYQSPTFKIARKPLNGKILHISLKIFSKSLISLIFIFNEHQINVVNKWKYDADCLVTTHITVLPKLCNRQQWTSLIRSGELEVKGDLQVLQYFILLSNLAEFDLIELISPYIGDIASEGINKIFRISYSFFHKAIQRQKRYIADILTEEWKIIPNSLELEWFIKEMASVDNSITEFGKRLEKLEEK